MVETTSGDGWTPNKVHDWVMTIKEDLNQHAEEMQTRSRCRRKMYRVRTNLRQLKPEHYDAEQISLGLFDRFPSRASMSRADRCRTAMAHTFLEVMGMTMDELCELVVPGPKEMQDLYDEIGRTPLSLKEVQFVLTLDAVFVACWFATEYDPGFRQDFPAFQAAREAIVPIFVLMDLFKVENQIPLSLLRVVLLILVEKAEPEKKHEEQVAKANKFLSNLCVGIISDMRVGIPGFDPENPEFDKEDIQHLESLECEHLLDFLHQMMCHGIKREDENFDQGSMEHGARTSDTSN